MLSRLAHARGGRHLLVPLLGIALSAGLPLGSNAATSPSTSLAYVPAAGAPRAHGAAAPAARGVGDAVTREDRRELSIRLARPARPGDVLVAGIAVRVSRARAVATPRGWRVVAAARARGLVQRVYLRVAGRDEPRTYSWRFARPAAAAGGIVAYMGVDTRRPLASRSAAAAGALSAARARRLVRAPGLRTSASDTRVVGFFATAGRRWLAPASGLRPRYRVRSRRVSAAGFDFAKRSPGATGRRTAVARCPSPRRCAAAPAVGRLIALRPAGTAPEPPGSPPPGAPPRARLPSPLPESTGATFHVSVAGSDSNPGTAAAPWRTIQKAADTLAPNERALVASGTYVENVRVERAGTASGPITIEAKPGDSAILESAGSHALEFASDAGWFRVRGLTIQDSPGTSGGNVDVYGHHIEISSNEIRGGRDQGIYSDEESRSAYILGNWIHHNGEGIRHQSHGIYLQGADHLVSTNVIHDHPEGFGIQVYDANRDSIVVNNTVVRSGHSGIVIGGAGGVSGIRVHNNIFAFNDQWGIKHDSDCPSSTVADHNVIWANGYEPIEEGCSGLDTSGGNVLADPRFVDLGARNLHLAPGSAAIDQGLPEWALSVDFDGDARPQGAAPDDGAFEDG